MNKKDFIFKRHETLQDFTCARCTQTKRSKIKVTWLQTNNLEKTICNGCYGNLLSQIQQK